MDVVRVQVQVSDGSLPESYSEFDEGFEPFVSMLGSGLDMSLDMDSCPNSCSCSPNSGQTKGQKLNLVDTMVFHYKINIS